VSGSLHLLHPPHGLPTSARAHRALGPPGRWLPRPLPQTLAPTPHPNLQPRPPCQNRDDDDLPIQAVEQRPITTDDLRGALEAMLVSSTFGVVGVTHLDEDAIADGRPGYMTMALQAVLTNDREPKPGSARHIPVPYGGITGMASQLM
jgi:hypothetical protein